jgi:hypothetical protein
VIPALKTCAMRKSPLLKNADDRCGLRRNRIKSKENGTARKGKRKQSPEGKST